MLIILSLYVVLIWLVIKFKLIKWGWLSGTIVVLGGAFILAVFLAMFNYLTPSGSFTVTRSRHRGNSERIRPSDGDTSQA